MTATDTHSDPLTQLAAAEDAFQDARALLKEAEAKRYASIWAALTTAADMTELRAALPATVSVHSLRAAVRRHATGDTRYIQPELFETLPGADAADLAVKLAEKPGRPIEFGAEQQARYKGRNVERCFNKLKQPRGIAMRSDKTARAYRAAIALAATLIWIKTGVIHRP